ncbi:MAG TPA: transcriptional regulator [Corynebacterium casei]|uniref:HigA2-like helix-turn-helix domain-containing protein n=1 Tax=Corynebacterium casei UCMA 3821 TaxID=1110505 RepID=G7HZN9_9CORY|nr:XRE family transcriptional regulator [Corynebacterium casei]CCE55654.1 putative uncharacterized protein [Corynebacterium casei UCMA 3821]HCJ69315.1 transcriptional regulator [Corynebacterium casei]
MSVWDDIEESTGEAANLKLRAKFMRAIRAEIAARGLQQSEAAAQLELAQPRVSELLSGKMSRFQLDALVGIGAKLGIRALVQQGAKHS